jgi:outer membrane protein
MNALLVVLSVLPIQGRVLTLEDALSTAMANQPTVVQAKATTAVYRARANETRSFLLPQLNGTGIYSRRTSNVAPNPGITNVGTGMGMSMMTPPPSFDTVNFWSFGLQLQQLLFDFGQTYYRWRSAQEVASSQAAGEVNSYQIVAQQVRTAFFQARAQKGLVEVAKQTLANYDVHLHQVEGFVKAGTRPEIDLAQARTDSANARVQLISTDNNYLTAKAQLNQAMGVFQGTDYDVADETLPPVDVEDQSIDVLSNEAEKARPDVVALEKQVRAQYLQIKSAWGSIGPAISASMGLTDQGTDISNLAWNWNVSANVSWPLFNGLLNWETVKEQKAQLIVVKAQLDALRLQVRLDVEQARLAVRASKENIVATREAQTNAQERLRLAQGRYQAGVGNAIELGDAQVALTNAQAQYVSAEYNLAQARAQLLKALGRR